MTSNQYKLRDLRRWNHLQMAVMQRLNIPLEADSVLAFGEWFANYVDSLGRLPRWEEIRTSSDSAKKLGH